MKTLQKLNFVFKPQNFDALKNKGKIKWFSTESKLEDHRAKLMARGLPKVKPIQGVKDIVLVCSGKGGVGKSTTSVNIATGLKIVNPTKTIGLLDTDVFGPSVPLMMNLNDTPLLNNDNLMEPLTNYGVKCMSMGFLIEKGAAAVWRGLMVMQALEKLMRQVHWGDLDCLIIDTPPGTGDTQLSLVQNLPISGVVLVTTPQLAAIEVTRRGAAMFEKLNIPIIGIVENMSSVTCNHCSNQVRLFGEGTETLAKDLNVPILASIPLEKEISSNGDKGVPIVIAKPDSVESNSYKGVAKSIINYLENLQEKQKLASV